MAPNLIFGRFKAARVDRSEGLEVGLMKEVLEWILLLNLIWRSDLKFDPFLAA